MRGCFTTMTDGANSETFTMAAVQYPPVYWDPDASADLACELIGKAAQMGADLVCFGESWLPGYPFFIHGLPGPEAQEHALNYLANAIEIPGPHTAAIGSAAAAHGVDVVIGVAERSHMSNGSVYCTILFFDGEGNLLGRHRKLKPTYLERLVWADGDLSGLVTHQRPYGRISGLNCWEHQMMLPGYALAMQGTQIHVATWPGWEPEAASTPVNLEHAFWPRMSLLSRAFASQAGCYVVAVGGLWRLEDVSDNLRSYITTPRTGDSMIIGPSGHVLAGPLHGEAGILLAQGSLREVAKAKLQADIVGHYARPDLFRSPVPPAEGGLSRKGM